MDFDPTYPFIDMNEFKECKWKDFYGDLKEAIPPNTPEKMGKEVDLCGYVDSQPRGRKEIKEVLFWVFHIIEYSNNPTVLQ